MLTYDLQGAAAVLKCSERRLRELLKLYPGLGRKAGKRIIMSEADLAKLYELLPDASGASRQVAMLTSRSSSLARVSAKLRKQLQEEPRASRGQVLKASKAKDMT